LPVDLGQGLGRADVVRIALQVVAWLVPVSETTMSPPRQR